jgi:hypothetical protein
VSDLVLVQYAVMGWVTLRLTLVLAWLHQSMAGWLVLAWLHQSMAAWLVRVQLRADFD